MTFEAGTALEPVAIIGMTCVFPKAPDLGAFWSNLLLEVDAVGEPLPAWDASRYLDSDRIHTHRGGYLKDLYRFDPSEFGIMPNSVDGGEPDQFLALRITRDVLRDAGYLDADYDHRDTGIILGHSTYLHRGQGNLIQHNIVIDQTIDLLSAVVPSLTDEKLTEIRELLERKLPQFNADVAPSLVPNVMTGRIANRLDLRGPNYLVDAACSSSLLAVNAAIDELRAGRSRMMLAGGVNASLPAEVSVIFTLLGALSGRGKVRPFESGSDGTLLGEGLGVVLLKRASDAIADGDRIYALVRGVGQASDGRGHGLLAPSVDGETLAIERAYAATGVDPSTVSLIEAHGTGIPLGDATEITALRNVLGDRRGRSGTVAIGSVKSMISHCIPAAGIAGLIKTALALHHKILPPTLCDEVNPELGIETTPLYVNTKARPWIASPDRPRRAGVNSFGFGGINAHAILEEAPAEAKTPLKSSPWPVELCVLSADQTDGLLEEMVRLERFAEANPDALLRDVAAELLRRTSGGDRRLAIVARDLSDLVEKLGQAKKKLAKNGEAGWATRSGIVYGCAPLQGTTAFLFPGEGSQYLGMLSDLAMCFDEVRDWFDFWYGLYPDSVGGGRTDVVFPPESEQTAERCTELEKELHGAEVGSESVFIGGQAMHSLLEAFGVRADVMLGHSSGESSALVAAKAIPADDPREFARLVRELNGVYRRMLAADEVPTGALLAVGALEREVVDAQIAQRDGVFVAMENCANQAILFGDRATIETLQKSLSEAGGICMILPFDRGYHTPVFEGIGAAFRSFYDEIGLTVPALPLYSCATADLFPSDEQGVRDLAASQWSRKVRFKDTIERMHRDGVRCFVEVGPSGNLTAFVKNILAGRELLALSTNERSRGGLEQLLAVLAHLYVNGKPVDLKRLFADRCTESVDLVDGVRPRPAGMLLDNTMPVVRLDEDDRKRLREMIRAVQPSVDAARVEDAESAENASAEPRRLADVVAPVSDARDVGAADGVVEGYFGLMQDFLARQSALVRDLTAEIPSSEPAADGAEEHAPFLTSVLERSEEHVLAECRLSLHEDLFLRHHVLSGPVSAADPELLGLSCVPLMVSLEVMAEACALLDGSTGVRVIENVRASEWIALDRGEAVLEVHAEVLDRERRIYGASLVDEAGNVVVSARYGFEPDWRCAALADLTEARGFFLKDEQLYSTGMFHGPLFRSVRHVRGWSDEGIDADLSPVGLCGFFREAELPSMVLNPVLLDALGQLSAYWIAQQIGLDFNCFPSTIDRIELYAECPQEVGKLALRARQDGRGSALRDMAAPRSWQFECLDESGQPLLRVANLANVFYSVPHNFVECRRDPLTGWLGRPQETASSSETLLWQLEHLPSELLSASRRIFLRTLAHVFLSVEERLEWQELTTMPGRAREWLLGRACVKEAVRQWIHAGTGTLVHPAEVVVHHDEWGAPWVDGWWNGVLVEAPTVSLAHDDRVSLAAVTRADRNVGIDVERLGRVEEPELVLECLTRTERSLFDSLSGEPLEDLLLRIWCAKEAAAKYVGSGLNGNPAAFEVAFTSDDYCSAVVKCFDREVQVAVIREGNSIIALASEPDEKRLRSNHGM